MNSRPTEAVPSAVFGPSNGWTNVRPSVASISSARVNASCTLSTNSISAPSSRHTCTRNAFAVFGITTFAVVPSRRAE